MKETRIHSYMIRNYQDKDADQIAAIDVMAMLAYRYNGDYIPDNIFCAVNEEGEILGFGHIVPDATWFVIEDDSRPADFVHKLNVDITLNEDLNPPEKLRNELWTFIVNRAIEYRGRYPEKRVRVSHTISTDDLEEMDFYLSKGFDTRRTHLVMKRDLTEEIPDHPLPAGMVIRNWKMTSQQEEEQYLEAEAKGDLNGAPWSLNHLRWNKGGGEWAAITAFCEGEVAGSVMTWSLSDERGATENIFVLPEWRRKGVAKAVVTEALKHLRDNGKKEATLGVFGDNGGAVSLYLSLGYRLMDTVLEFGLDL
jgi:GNAT superfamily N-acetyltransferase